MITLTALRTQVSRDLRDTANKTFAADAVGDLINEALAELGRISPDRFLDDILPIADTLSYQLRAQGTTKTLTTPFGVASTNLLTSTAHGLIAGQTVKFVTLLGGTGLTVGTTYYVIATGLTANAFEVSATSGGAALDFTTDITAGTFRLIGAGIVDAVPEIEVRRVEVWDVTTTPQTFRYLLTPASDPGYMRTSVAGWEAWGGILYLSKTQIDVIDVTKNVIRVQGYAPYPPLVADTDVTSLSNELQWALRIYCQVAALRRLTGDRTLFAQWQTHSGNSDTTLAGLMSELNTLQADWNRRERRLFVYRENF